MLCGRSMMVCIVQPSPKGKKMCVQLKYIYIYTYKSRDLGRLATPSHTEAYMGSIETLLRCADNCKCFTQYSNIYTCGKRMAS